MLSSTVIDEESLRFGVRIVKTWQFPIPQIVAAPSPEVQTPGDLKIMSFC
jgi:hypothetical protein